jgi:hypothetical protein
VLLSVCALCSVNGASVVVVGAMRCDDSYVEVLTALLFSDARTHAEL